MVWDEQNWFITICIYSLLGALSVAVPGEIRGLHTAWKKYGKLPWRDLVQPTINMTEDGFRIQLRLYEAAHTFRDVIEEDAGFRLVLLLSLFCILISV